MAKVNPMYPQEPATEAWPQADAPPGRMETLYVLRPDRLAAAGIEIRTNSDGMIEMRGIVSPCNYFSSELANKLLREHGDREADRILDKAGSAITNELFILNFRKVLD